MRFDDVAPVLPGSRPVACARWESLARLGVVAVWRWHAPTREINAFARLTSEVRDLLGRIKRGALWTIVDEIGGVHHCRGAREILSIVRTLQARAERESWMTPLQVRAEGCQAEPDKDEDERIEREARAAEGRCLSCGFALGELAGFCPVCGADVAEDYACSDCGEGPCACPSPGAARGLPQPGPRAMLRPRGLDWRGVPRLRFAAPYASGRGAVSPAVAAFLDREFHRGPPDPHDDLPFSGAVGGGRHVRA